MWHFLMIGFGVVFSAFYGFGMGLAARVWWLAREPGEAAKAVPHHERSDAA